MPELPEVETTRLGLLPHLQQQVIAAVVVRQFRLRWPIPEILLTALPKQTISQIQRRGKYLLLACDTGHILIHLGMSGSLRVLAADTSATKHDHVDIVLNNGQCLRYHDPRRFGCILWTTEPVLQHSLLAKLGPEPLSTDFTSDYLWRQLQQRRSSIKSVIMDSHVVVGVGNIYASESLFLAGIHPQSLANTLSHVQSQRLTTSIQTVLQQAIAAGGTTLRDFTNSEGKPGYFQQALQVYGRSGKPCLICNTLIQQLTQHNRSTYFCPQCQLKSL